MSQESTTTPSPQAGKICPAQDAVAEAPIAESKEEQQSLQDVSLPSEEPQQQLEPLKQTPESVQIPPAEATSTDENSAAPKTDAAAQESSTVVMPAAEQSASAAEQADDIKQSDAAIKPALPLSFAARCFNALAALGPLAVVLLVALLFVPGLQLRGFIGDEARFPELLAAFPGPAQGLFAYLNGTPDPNVQPLWLWFAHASSWAAVQAGLPEMPVTMLWAGIGTLGLLLMMLLIWGVACRMAGGCREALAACVIFFATLPLFGLTRFILPETLFVTFTLLSLLFLWQGWVKPFAPFSLFFGFVCAALAVFAGGFAGILLPLLSSLLFLIWRGTFRRAGALDGALCFGIGLVLILGWLVWLGIEPATSPALDAFLEVQKNQWGQGIWQTPADLVQLAHLAIFALPWILILVALPWERLYRLPVHLWKDRTEQPAIGWLWCSTISAFILFALSWPGSDIMVLPFSALASILAGRAVMRLTPLRSKLFFFLAGLCLLVFAISIFTKLLPEDLLIIPEAVRPFVPQSLIELLALPGIYYLGLISLLFAILLLFAVDKRFPGGALLLFILLLVALAQPLNFVTLPAIAPVSTVAEQPAQPQSSVAPAESPATSVEQPGQPLPDPRPAAEPMQPAATVDSSAPINGTAQ